MDSKELKRAIVDLHYRTQSTHVGSALGIADIIEAVQPGIRNCEFVLSKAQGGSALYAYLNLHGLLDTERMLTMGTPEFPMQPDRTVETVNVTTGSLGMGLSFACGMAIAEPDKQVICVISDAELQEGSIWESVQFASRQKLSNLRLIVDLNKKGALGKAPPYRSLVNVFNGFGWSVATGSGHNIERIRDWLDYGLSQEPKVYIADTIFGKGFSRAEEDQLKYHYSPPDDDDYALAMEELNA